MPLGGNGGALKIRERNVNSRLFMLIRRYKSYPGYPIGGNPRGPGGIIGGLAPGGGIDGP